MQVEVSLDQGKTWQKCSELLMEDKPVGKVWSWTLWRYTLDCEKLDKGAHKIQVRAIDSKGKVQDGEIAKLFNLRGIMNNSPHEITVNVV